MKRRALSTVVGAVFFVIVMTSSIAYVSYSMDLIDSLARAVEIKQNQDIDRNKEEAEITAVSTAANKFNLTLKNTGNIPINVTRLWAQNLTDSSWNHTKHQINKAVFPGQTETNIGQNINLIALDSQSYSLKLATERGNIFNVQVLSPQNKAIKMNLFSTPRSVLDGQNVTIWYGVTNNLTDGSILQLITPQIEDPPDTTGGAIATYVEGPTPATDESITLGETAFFKWVYEVSGNSGGKVTFNVTINNAKQGNYVTEPIEIISVPPDDTAFVENAGTITADYDSIEWGQKGNGWASGFNIDNNRETVWRVNVTNNDPSLTFYIGEDTAFVLDRLGGTATEFFLAGSANPNPDPPTITAYTDESQILTPGQKATVYFGATSTGGSTVTSTPPQSDYYRVPIVIFGTMCSGGGCPGSGTAYGQNIPFIAILISQNP